MKNFLKLLPFLVLLFLTLIYKKDIHNFIIEKIIFDKSNYTIVSNEYAINHKFLYVEETDNFIAENIDDVISILYTGLNRGNDYFYFFCKYDECENDIDNLIDSKELLVLNDYIHPYNGFQKLYISIDSINKVSVTVDKTYNNDDIENLNQKIDDITNKILTDEMTLKEKIIKFHDYIIDTTTYDVEYVENNLNNIYYPSHTAIGPIIYNKALCGGYASIMAIFLNNLNVPNYRIASEFHVWNYVKLDNKWYHLDLTWDDPITNTKEDIRLDKFLLIDTKTLETFATGYHDFDKTLYLEANQTY